MYKKIFGKNYKYDIDVESYAYRFSHEILYPKKINISKYVETIVIPRPSEDVLNYLKENFPNINVLIYFDRANKEYKRPML